MEPLEPMKLMEFTDPEEVICRFMIWAETKGFKLIKRRTPSCEKKSYTLSCNRSGFSKRKTLPSGEFAKTRNRRTKKCQCAYSFRIGYLADKNVWYISSITTYDDYEEHSNWIPGHNHTPDEVLIEGIMKKPTKGRNDRLQPAILSAIEPIIHEAIQAALGPSLLSATHSAIESAITNAMSPVVSTLSNQRLFRRNDLAFKSSLDVGKLPLHAIFKDNSGIGDGLPGGPEIKGVKILNIGERVGYPFPLNTEEAKEISHEELQILSIQLNETFGIEETDHLDLRREKFIDFISGL